MSRAAKVPQAYHFYIAALQRLIALTEKDSRLDVKEKETVRVRLSGASEVLSKVSARPLPKEE